VASTINRLVSFFPVEEQAAVRARIADNVKAIVSLRLLVNKKEDARVPAVEILRSTRSIQECIRDASRTTELTDYLARSRSDRMQTFDQHLLDLLKANKISTETALAAASNPADFQTKLQLEGDEDVSATDVEKEDAFGSDVRF
jgi:twitching motility protein PilT